MSVTINDDDVIWTMDWSKLKEDGSRMYPEKPLTEQIFETEKGLAVLLAEEIAFLNTNWWEEEWPKKAQETFAVFVNCNDIFAWGCADAEGLSYNEVEEVYKYHKADPIWGSTIWCIIKRNLMPQAPVYRDIIKDGRWNLDLMELRPNHSWHSS